MPIIPVVVLLSIIFVVFVFGLQEIFVYNPPFLLFTLQLVLWAVATFATIYVSLKSFLHSGSWIVLLNSSSILIFAISAIVAGWAGNFSGNYGLLIGNGCALVSSIIMLVSGAMPLIRKNEAIIAKRKAL